jgi:hypothetical protein
MNATRRRTAAPALVLALGFVIIAQVAFATHPRPKGAALLRVALVPASKPCVTPNEMHGGGLATPSCSPPEQSSSYLTVGTPDANGAASNSIGFLRIKVKASSPEDVLVSGSISDVRCRPATAASVCNSPNEAGGPDYSGDLSGYAASARFTDHYNGPIGGTAGTDAGTAQDFSEYYFALFHCSNTPDVTVGGLCTVDTTRPVSPLPYWFEGKRINSEFGQLQVEDGGPDGNVSTDDNTLFAVQGLFVP